MKAILKKSYSKYFWLLPWWIIDIKTPVEPVLHDLGHDASGKDGRYIETGKKYCQFLSR